MTAPKKETIWITIPDEGASPVKTSAKVSERNSFDKVDNKIFWAAGFIALLVFVAVLFAPQEFVGLMKGQLFDGSFTVVPESVPEESGALFGGLKQEETVTEGTATEETTSTTEPATETTTPASETTTNGNGVQAESEAVSIQVEPLAESEVTGTVTAEAGTEPTGAESAATTGTVGEATPTTETGAVTAPSAETTDTNAMLLQSLSQQLDEYKKKQTENEQLIQELMQMLQEPGAGLHGAAAETGAAATTTLGTAPLGTTPTPITGTQPSGTYRYNTHTVTVSPYDVLAQNKGIQSQQAAYLASTAYTQGQVSAPSYTALAGVKGQPGTGPKETLLFAFVLASLGVLVWGVMRAIRTA